MHRHPLMEQIRDYALRHPEEGETVAAFLAFVESEPECFCRSLAVGHITGSAWVVNGDGSEVLLTHHRKLDRWLQLGGHADGESDVLCVAMKEAEEESGLVGFTHIGDGIFDIDIHPIPARKGEPEHLHYDVRYLLRANGSTDYIVSDESHDLRWVKPDDVETLTGEPSMKRMVEKWKALRSFVSGEGISASPHDAAKRRAGLPGGFPGSPGLR
ncbi:NUDIX hydrolase [Akkermansiaceae bacterium]|nr:NUDIX hydrolase [Akkermansiaceae bacterium]